MTVPGLWSAGYGSMSLYEQEVVCIAAASIVTPKDEKQLPGAVVEFS